MNYYVDNVCFLNRIIFHIARFLVVAFKLFSRFLSNIISSTLRCFFHHTSVGLFLDAQDEPQPFSYYIDDTEVLESVAGPGPR